MEPTSFKERYEFTPNFNGINSYALGLLWADGYLRFNKKGFRGKHLGIEVLAKDFEDFKSSLSTLGNLTTRDRQREGRQKQTIGTITNLGLCEWLFERGFKDKSKVSPCGILKAIPAQYHRDFIRGWSDGDGCFYVNNKNNTYQFTIAGSYDQDWSAFINFLNTLEIKFRYKQVTQIQNGRENRSSYIRITNIGDLNKLTNAIYYNEVENFLTRKKEKAFSIPDNLVYARKAR